MWYNARTVNETGSRTFLGPEHVEAVLDCLPGAIWTISRDFTITSFNRAAERITGFRRAEVLGRCCHDVFRSPACKTAGDCPMTRALHTGCATSTRRFTIRNHRNEETPVLLSFCPLRDLRGEIVGGVETIQEFTPASDSSLHARRPEPTWPLKAAAMPPTPTDETEPGQPWPGREPSGEPADLPILDATERRAIEDVLRKSDWNRTTAARKLGISRITLWRKMRKLDIRPPQPLV